MCKGNRNRAAGKVRRALKLAPHSGANRVGDVPRSGNRAHRRHEAAVLKGKGQVAFTPPRGPGKHAGESARAALKKILAKAGV